MTRCRESGGKRVIAPELRQLCEQELSESITPVHFGTTLAKIFPSVRPGNNMVAGRNEQYYYDIEVLNPNLVDKDETETPEDQDEAIASPRKPRICISEIKVWR